MSLEKTLKKVFSVTLVVAFMLQQSGFVFAATPESSWSSLKTDVEATTGEYNVTTALTADDAPNGTINITVGGNTITGASLTENSDNEPLFNVGSGVTSFNLGNDVSGSIVNNGTMTYTGSSLANGSVTGSGKFVFGATTTNANSITQGTVETTTAANVTNNAAITSTTFTNKGTFDNNALITASISNESGATLLTDPDHLGGAVANEGIVKLDADGNLTQNITGTAGKTEIRADVNNQATISQDTIKVGTGHTLTSDADNLVATTEIFNDGTLNLTAGTNANAINGDGEVAFSNTVTNNGAIAQTTVSNSGALTNNAAMTAQLTNTGTIDGTGSVKLTDDSSSTGSITQNDFDSNGYNFSNTSDFTANASFVNSATFSGVGGSLTLASGTANNSGSIAQDAVTNAADFVNAGVINTAALTNTGDISGGGSISLTGGSVNNGTIAQSLVTISNNATFDNNGMLLAKANNASGSVLNSDADNLGDDVLNDGALNLNGTGTLTIDVTGTGDTNINGDLTNQGTISQDNINVASGYVVTSNASDMTATTAINNDGIINYTAGTTANTITGSGRVDITGYVTNTGDIDVTTVGNSGVFTNKGTVDANLKNTGDIEGTGSITTKTGISSNIGSINQDTLTNNGTFDNSGHIVLTDALTNNATFNTNADLLTATNGVVNTGDFNITGGTNTNVITGAGTTNFKGDATNNVAITQTTVTNSANLTNNALITADVTNTGTLTSKGADIAGDIANTGTYVISDGNNANDIIGAGGKTTILGDTTNTGVIMQETLAVANSGNLTTDSDLITASITNDGKLTWNAGTANQNVINGSGELHVNGADITNSSLISQDNIKILSGSLTSNADLLASSQGISNADGLIFTGGTNTNAITGAGTLTVNGDVVNQSTIEQDTITVSGGKLTTAADALTTAGGVVNNSEISFTSGDNNNAISGTGTTYIDGSVQNLAAIDTVVQVNTGAHYGTATDILKKLENRGTTDLIDADVASTGKISGTGVTNILGATVNNSSISQSAVNIAAGGKLTTASDQVEAAVTNDGDLEWNGGSANTNVISGNGSLEITSGTTIANTAAISQGGITITSGTLTTDADLLAAASGIINNDGLTFTGGTNANAVSGTGDMSVTGDVTNQADIVQATVTVTGTLANEGTITADVTNSGVLASDGDDITGDITNSGTYIIVDGDNANDITGTGDVQIEGTTINTATISQDNIFISEGAKLVADDITNITTNTGIDNSGTLELQSGINDNAITGNTGALSVTGAVTNNSGVSISQDTIDIATLGDFTADAGDLVTVNGITNTGKLTLGDGATANNISGTGTLAVTGTITNTGNIDQKSLSNSGTLTSNADLLAFADGITNTNTLNLTGGTNSNIIAGTGTTNFTNDVMNDAEITQAIVTNDAGTLANNAAITATFINNTGTVNNEAVITGSITNTNGTINSTADNLNGVVTNNGTLNVSGGTVQNTISGAGDTNILNDLVNAQNITQDKVYNAGNMTNDGAITVSTSFTNDGILDNGAAITGAIINNGTIASAADNLVGAVTNDGTLNLEGGVVQNTISGVGETNITADLVNGYAINQTNVTNTAALTNNATITATDITNSGTIIGKASDLVASNEIANDGSLVFDAASTGASKISGMGDVQVTANTTLTGANTYQGGTLIDGSTLTVAGASNIGTGDVTFANGGILDVTAAGSLDHNLVGQTAADDVTVQNAAALTLNGNIGVANDFYKLGAGDMTFAMASNTYTGDTYVNAGKLIGNTGNINNVVYGATGTTIQFNDTTDADLNEINADTFEQIGTGVLNVQNNLFTANTVNVNAGTFAANRALTATTLNVNSGATLRGNGNITGDVYVNSGATLAPGNSIDTLTITGDLNLASGSTTAIEITDTPASDKVVATGNANIASGANLAVSNISGRYFEWESFDILEAANVAGTFTYDGSIDGYDTSRIEVAADYTDPTKVTLTAKRKATDYNHTTGGLSRNQSEAAHAMDSVSTGFGGDITNALLQLEKLGGLNPADVTLINPGSTLTSALDDLHGVLYANTVLTNLFNARTAHVYDRIAKRNPSAGKCPTCHDNLWVEYYNQHDRVYQNANSPRFTNNMSGVLVGYDRSSDELLLGVYGGFGKSDLRQNNGKMDIEDSSFGIYSGYMKDNWILKGTLYAGLQNYSAKRTIAFMNRTASANYEGWSVALDVEGGYNVEVFDWLNVKPFIGALGSYAHQQAFSERDAGALNLEVERHDQFNTQARLGVQLDGKVKSRLSWYGSVAVKRFIGDDYAKLHMTMGLPNTRMNIISAELGTTYFSGQVGLNYALTDSLSVYGNLDTGLNSKSTNCYGNLGLAYTW